MNSHILKKIAGMLLVCIGITGITGLIFFYSVVLFSEKWTLLQGINESFELIFTVPTGIVVIYASFFAVFIPLFLTVLLGMFFIGGRSYLQLWQIGALILLWSVSLILGSVTTIHQVQKIVDRIQPFSNDPVAFEISQNIPYEVQTMFAETLKSEVDAEQGVPIEGYEPFMFMEAFPGLTPTDFEGVQASIGNYTVQGGKLVHVLDESRLVHSSAKAVTDEGLHTLLGNISVRLKVNLTQEGTLTEIMEALLPKKTSGEPVLEQPVACTLEAKICPDGSSVGRQGPRCEFEPCPQ